MKRFGWLSIWQVCPLVDFTINNYLNSCRMEKKYKVDIYDNFNGLVDSFYMPLLLKLLIGIMTVRKYPH